MAVVDSLERIHLVDVKTGEMLEVLRYFPIKNVLLIMQYLHYMKLSKFTSYPFTTMQEQ